MVSRRGLACAHEPQASDGEEMSGGGGGGGPGGGFQPRQERTPCDQLRFATSIASPQQAAGYLSVGDMLQVQLSSGAAQSIDLVGQSGNVVGSIITHIPDLLRCIQDGYSYEADVLSVNGGMIRVEVRPA